MCGMLRCSFIIDPAPVPQLLTEVERKLRVVVSLSVGDEVDLVLSALLLEALFGAPVLTHTAD